MKIRVIIVDDEQLALARLSRLLEQVGDLEVIAALDDAGDAPAAIKRLQPDLVVLDVEMPQMDGFDIVEALARQPPSETGSTPLIAFVTAYPQFALQAFDTGAIDFICKPVRLPRLEIMVDRARRALIARDATQRLQDLRANLKELREATAHVEEHHFWVRNRGELLRITTSAVQWIEAHASYVQLHLGDRSYLVRNSIGSMTEQLADQGYVRVHKSALVNRSKVVAVKSSAGRLTLVLDGGTEIGVGRKYRCTVNDLVERTS